MWLPQQSTSSHLPCLPPRLARIPQWGFWLPVLTAFPQFTPHLVHRMVWFNFFSSFIYTKLICNKLCLFKVCNIQNTQFDILPYGTCPWKHGHIQGNEHRCPDGFFLTSSIPPSTLGDHWLVLYPHSLHFLESHSVKSGLIQYTLLCLTSSSNLF